MTVTDAAQPQSTTRSEIDSKIQLVRAGFANGVLRDLDSRTAQLEALKSMLTEHTDDFSDALGTDLGKSAIESYITEIGFLINEIDHNLKHLERWTRPAKVKLPLHLQPGSARVHREPFGTVLIIAPWNYPLQLALAPLIPAIAAGNTAVVKPSEIAPATASMIANLLPKYLDSGVAQVVLGAVDETTMLLGEAFDHIFYTGNGTVGRVVMRAAAEHLTPVTLELGGKSPTFVTQSANLEVAARRIVWGKFTNAGQTCVAPDYLLVDEQVAAPLLVEIEKAVTAMFGANPQQSDDYGRIVNERHFDRLKSLLVEAIDTDDADVVVGGDSDRGDRYIAPTVVTGVDGGSALMADEIFGPILPVITYQTLTEAIEFVTDRDKPLAMYIFSEDGDMADFILERTSSGGACVNHTLLHLAVPELPFGGVGPSGMGAYHGEAGFLRFSHEKSVLNRRTKPDPSIAYPPYSGLKKKILKAFF